MERKVYCPFCGNPSTIDHKWFNEATSTINELRTRAEAAEARAEKAEEYIKQDFLKPLYEQRDEALARAADLAESNRELSESVKTLRAERAQLREALNGMIYGWRDYANGHYCQTYNPGMMQGLNCAADALEAFVSGLDMISATVPASHAEQEA